jgi:hypothetical protein
VLPNLFEWVTDKGSIGWGKALAKKKPGQSLALIAPHIEKPRDHF